MNLYELSIQLGHPRNIGITMNSKANSGVYYKKSQVYFDKLLHQRFRVGEHQIEPHQILLGLLYQFAS